MAVNLGSGIVSEAMQATISAVDATASRWDAIVIGAGLAGSIAARGLALAGQRVLLIEKNHFPRDKVCGACLNGDALAGLAAVGLLGEVKKLGGHALNRYRLQVGARHLQVPLDAGHAVSRRALDGLLVRAAITAGVQYLSPAQAAVADVDPGDRNRVVRLIGTDYCLHASVVVVAAGLVGQQRIDDASCQTVAANDSRIGLGMHAARYPAFYQPGTIYMAVSSGGYVGLTCTEGGILNIAAAVDRDLLKQHSGAETLALILQSAGMPADASMFDHPCRGTAPLTRRRQMLASHRLFFIGDAAGYVEPFTGEGMAWAVRGARAVIPFALAAIDDWNPNQPLIWTQTCQQIIGRHQWLCRGFAGLLRRPQLCSVAIRAAMTMPMFGRAIVRKLNQVTHHEVLDHRPGHRIAV